MIDQISFGVLFQFDDAGLDAVVFVGVGLDEPFLRRLPAGIVFRIFLTPAAATKSWLNRRRERSNGSVAVAAFPLVGGIDTFDKTSFVSI